MSFAVCTLSSISTCILKGTDFSFLVSKIALYYIMIHITSCAKNDDIGENVKFVCLGNDKGTRLF
jgi:hypothetical protein